MALLANKKNSDLLSEPGMHFWGMTCLSGKNYAQKVGERFHITMAVLDPTSAPKNPERNKTISLVAKRGQCEYLLCVLKHEEIPQVNLNLIFDKGENVIFQVRGPGNVCLSGYQQIDSEKDVQNDEIECLCPVVGVNKEKEQENELPKSEPESVSPKRKKKAKKEKDFVTPEDRKTLENWNSISNEDKNGDSRVLEFDDVSDDPSDEDFCINKEENTESEESEDYDEEEIKEDLEEEIKMLKEDGEEEDDEVAEMEPESYSESRKRKHEKKSQVQEYSFNDDDSSDSDIMALPTTSDTPIPKKTMKIENSSEKKMSKKKKKKLNESNTSEKSVTESTPKKKEKAESMPNKNPVQKLEGGIEVQDVIVGKGPDAKKGKIVHVYYVGRFHDKKIFDARLPGKIPFSFKLGAQQVIKGWDIGLQGMKVGGKRKIKVPPSMAYGSSGKDDIPPNSTLFFLVELQAVS